MYTLIFDFKRKRSGTEEICEVYKDGKFVGSGDYQWSNRPWQRFSYEQALLKALKDAQVPYTVDLSQAYNVSGAVDLLSSELTVSFIER